MPINPVFAIVSASLAVAAMSAAGSAQARPALCAPQEAPIFSCSTGTKIVSLCASKDLGENTGALRYLFGARGTIELTYPAPGVPPRAAFAHGVTGGTGGGADFLRFETGGVTYTLFADHYRGRERDGLVVERGGRRIATLLCKSGAMDPANGWGAIYRAELPQLPPDFETP